MAVGNGGVAEQVMVWDPNNELDELPLSAAGLTRRDAMLDALIGSMKRTHRIRRVRRVATTVGVFALALMALRLWMPVSWEPNRSTPVAHAPVNPPPADVAPRDAAAPAVRIITVKTDPTIVERYRADVVEPSVMRLTDQALLETLASIHRPSGLIYYDGQVRLSRPVTDEELGLRSVDR